MSDRRGPERRPPSEPKAAPPPQDPEQPGETPDLDPAWGDAYAHERAGTEPRSPEPPWADPSWGDAAWAETAFTDEAWTEPGWSEPGWDQPRQQRSVTAEPVWPEADPTWTPRTPVGPDAWDDFDAVPVVPEAPTEEAEAPPVESTDGRSAAAAPAWEPDLADLAASRAEPIAVGPEPAPEPEPMAAEPERAPAPRPSPAVDRRGLFRQIRPLRARAPEPRPEPEPEPQQEPEPQPGPGKLPEPVPLFPRGPVPPRAPESETAVPRREPEPRDLEPFLRPVPDRPEEEPPPAEIDRYPSPARAEALEPVAAPVQTRLADEDEEDEEWDGTLERRRPTTAEQAVPWLIGVILLLAGMVIVLLALIFTSENGLPLLGSLSQNIGLASPEPTRSPTATPEPTSTPAAAAADLSATPAPTPTPTPAPVYGDLEMVYLGRSAALAPIYLLRKDFTSDGDPAVLAQDANQDVQSFVLSPDGTRGTAILAGVLVSIEPGAEKRQLATGISAMTFSPDGTTVYAVQITASGDTTSADIVAIDWLSGDSLTLASVSFPRPEVGDEQPIRNAQFADDGGRVRLYWMADATLRLWVAGAPAQQIDPIDGTVTELEGSEPPQLWSPDGQRQIQLIESGTTTTLHLVDIDGRELAMTSIDGLVSHLRWAPNSSQVVFTGGGSTAGGVVQDLYLWNLNAGDEPARLTATGAGFGAEWLGAAQFWAP